MTIKAIKEMFRPGQVWKVTRTVEGPQPFGPQVTLPRVESVTRREIKFKNEHSQFYTGIPKRKELVESRPGFVRFRHPAGMFNEMVVDLTLELQTATPAAPAPQ